MSYMVIRVYSFECDECGRVNDVTPRRDAATAREARRIIRADGWTTGAQRDLCRACSTHQEDDHA